jgi:hypothetical protein
VLAVRDVVFGMKAARDIKRYVPHARLVLRHVELASFGWVARVRSFAPPLCIVRVARGGGGAPRHPFCPRCPKLNTHITHT